MNSEQPSQVSNVVEEVEQGRVNSLKDIFSGTGRVFTPEQKLAYDKFYKAKQMKKAKRAERRRVQSQELIRTTDPALATENVERPYNSAKAALPAYVAASYSAKPPMPPSSSGVSMGDIFAAQAKKQQEDLLRAEKEAKDQLLKYSSVHSKSDEFQAELKRQQDLAKSTQPHMAGSNSASALEEFYTSRGRELRDTAHSSGSDRISSGSGNSTGAMEDFYTSRGRDLRDRKHSSGSDRPLASQNTAGAMEDFYTKRAKELREASQKDTVAPPSSTHSGIEEFCSSRGRELRNMQSGSDRTIAASQNTASAMEDFYTNRAKELRQVSQKDDRAAPPSSSHSGIEAFYSARGRELRDHEHLSHRGSAPGSSHCAIEEFYSSSGKAARDNGLVPEGIIPTSTIVPSAYEQFYTSQSKSQRSLDRQDSTSQVLSSSAGLEESFYTSRGRELRSNAQEKKEEAAQLFAQKSAIASVEEAFYVERESQRRSSQQKSLQNALEVRSKGASVASYEESFYSSSAREARTHENKHEQEARESMRSFKAGSTAVEDRVMDMSRQKRQVDLQAASDAKEANRKAGSNYTWSDIELAKLKQAQEAYRQSEQSTRESMVHSSNALTFYDLTTFAMKEKAQAQRAKEEEALRSRSSFKQEASYHDQFVSQTKQRDLELKHAEQATQQMMKQQTNVISLEDDHAFTKSRLKMAERESKQQTKDLMRKNGYLGHSGFRPSDFGFLSDSSDDEDAMNAPLECISEPQASPAPAAENPASKGMFGGLLKSMKSTQAAKAEDKQVGAVERESLQEAASKGMLSNFLKHVHSSPKIAESAAVVDTSDVVEKAEEQIEEIPSKAVESTPVVEESSDAEAEKAPARGRLGSFLKRMSKNGAHSHSAVDAAIEVVEEAQPVVPDMPAQGRFKSFLKRMNSITSTEVNSNAAVDAAVDEKVEVIADLAQEEVVVERQVKSKKSYIGNFMSRFKKSKQSTHVEENTVMEEAVETSEVVVEESIAIQEQVVEHLEMTEEASSSSEENTRTADEAETSFEAEKAAMIATSGVATAVAVAAIEDTDTTEVEAVEIEELIVEEAPVTLEKELLVATSGVATAVAVAAVTEEVDEAIEAVAVAEDHESIEEIIEEEIVSAVSPLSQAAEVEIVEEIQAEASVADKSVEKVAEEVSEMMELSMMKLHDENVALAIPARVHPTLAELVEQSMMHQHDCDTIALIVQEDVEEAVVDDVIAQVSEAILAEAVRKYNAAQSLDKVMISEVVDESMQRAVSNVAELEVAPVKEPLSGAEADIESSAAEEEHLIATIVAEIVENALQQAEKHDVKKPWKAKKGGLFNGFKSLLRKKKSTSIPHDIQQGLNSQPVLDQKDSEYMARILENLPPLLETLPLQKDTTAEYEADNEHVDGYETEGSATFEVEAADGVELSEHVKLNGAYAELKEELRERGVSTNEDLSDASTGSVDDTLSELSATDMQDGKVQEAAVTVAMLNKRKEMEDNNKAQVEASTVASMKPSTAA